MHRQPLVPMFVACFVVLVVFSGLYHYGTVDTLTATVKRTERIPGYKSSGKYLVFTDKETLECSDAWLFGKFDSSDMYGRIEPGNVYTFKVYGWRVPILSSYRNIIEVR